MDFFQKTPLKKSFITISNLHIDYRNRDKWPNTREIFSTFLRQFHTKLWNRGIKKSKKNEPTNVVMGW